MSGSSRRRSEAPRLNAIPAERFVGSTAANPRSTLSSNAAARTGSAIRDRTRLIMPPGSGGGSRALVSQSGSWDPQAVGRCDLESAPRTRHHLRPHRPTCCPRSTCHRQRSCCARRPGYQGENQRLTCRIKATARTKLTATQQTVNASHSARPRPGRTRKLPAQDHVQGAATGQPVPVADRRDHRSSTRPAPPPARTHNLISPERRSLLGKAQWHFSIMDLLG